MRKRGTIAVFLGTMLLLLSLSVVSSVFASSSQLSAYRFDAKGGIPGPPEKEPKPEEAAVEYELFIEIDYMQGHEPNSTVLEYVHTYYLERGINVTFYIDDAVPLDPSVSDTDFWTIEAAYNDLGDDKYTGELANFFSKWKWVLYGTTVEGAPNVVGYAYVVYSIKYNTLTGRILDVDGLAGNYIFIADETADDWAAANYEEYGTEDYEAEAVVLMHEMGHSIGIIKYGWSGNYYTGYTLWEIYDPDTSSVMSYLNPDNCNAIDKNGNPDWHYSKQYWRLRNMEYYTI
jgi:hypothetical protein